MELDDGEDPDPRLDQMGLSEAYLPVVVVPRTGATLRHPDDAALDRALLQATT